MCSSDLHRQAAAPRGPLGDAFQAPPVAARTTDGHGQTGVGWGLSGGGSGLGNEVRLQGAAIAAAAPVVWAVGLAPALTPLVGGALYLQPSLLQFAFADAASRCELRIRLPATSAAHGLPLLAQIGALDATATGGVALSNAVQALVP